MMSSIIINQCVSDDDDDDEILFERVKYSQFPTRCRTTAPSAVHSTTQARDPDSHSGGNLKKPEIRKITNCEIYNLGMDCHEKHTYGPKSNYCILRT